MNCFIWILLLLGCGGNSCNSNWNTWNNGSNCDCDDRMNRCGCGSNSDNWNERSNCGCDGMMARNMDNCGCDNMRDSRSGNSCDSCDNDNNWNSRSGNRSWQENSNYMSPPPVPGRVRDDNDCGCND